MPLQQPVGADIETAVEQVAVPATKALSTMEVMVEGVGGMQAKEATVGAMVGATTIVVEGMVTVVGGTTEATGEEDTGDMEVGATGIEGVTGVEVVVRAH